MSDNPRVKLFQKILAVQKVLQPLEKSGHNSYFKYDYSTAADVLLPVKEACNQHGLILISDTVDSRIEPGKAWATVQVTVFDCETGESISASCPSYAEDSKGDKAIFKALTNGLKYAVRSLFVLPSEDDSERTPNTSVPTTSNGKPHKTVHTLQSDESTSTNGKHATAARPLLHQPTPPISPAANNNSNSPSILEQTTEQMRRIGWTVDQGRRYLQETFGVLSRKHLTSGQMRQFLDFLRSLPAPERIPVPS